MKNNYLVFRLKPGSDLYEGILKACAEADLKAGAVISAVGCVSKVAFRKADGKTIHQETTDFEVTALSGTISEAGMHLHIQLCDQQLRSIGGHLCPGTIVNTTMEIVVVNLEREFQMTREADIATGYDELLVIKK